MTETTTETMTATTLLALTLSDAPYFKVDCVTDIEADGHVLLFTATGPTMTALCQWSRDEGVIVIEWRDESATERILAETHTLADLASVGITNTTDSLEAFRSRTNSAACKAACVGISADDFADYCADEMAQFDARMMGV